jgi:hypothetical protein
MDELLLDDEEGEENENEDNANENNIEKDENQEYVDNK